MQISGCQQVATEPSLEILMKEMPTNTGKFNTMNTTTRYSLGQSKSLSITLQ